MYSAVWSLVEMERRSVLYFLSKTQFVKLHSAVSDSRSKDVMFLAAVLCYRAYRNGVKKDQ
jgi:hypothetical protein